jgi:hypothetical protein
VTQLGLFDAAAAPAIARSAAREPLPKGEPPAVSYADESSAPAVKLSRIGRTPAPDEVGDWMLRVEGKDNQGRAHFQFLQRYGMAFAAACDDAAETATRLLGFTAVDAIVVLP